MQSCADSGQEHTGMQQSVCMPSFPPRTADDRTRGIRFDSPEPQQAERRPLGPFGSDLPWKSADSADFRGSAAKTEKQEGKY